MSGDAAAAGAEARFRPQSKDCECHLKTETQLAATRVTQAQRAGSRRDGVARGEISGPTRRGPRALAPGAGSAPAIHHMLHRAMRGRYALAVILGLATGGACAALGWHQARPTYHSESL